MPHISSPHLPHIYSNESHVLCVDEIHCVTGICIVLDDLPDEVVQ
jgi:hypothetical protein